MIATIADFTFRVSATITIFIQIFKKFTKIYLEKYLFILYFYSYKYISRDIIS